MHRQSMTAEESPVKPLVKIKAHTAPDYTVREGHIIYVCAGHRHLLVMT